MFHRHTPDAAELVTAHRFDTKYLSMRCDVFAKSTLLSSKKDKTHWFPIGEISHDINQSIISMTTYDIWLLREKICGFEGDEEATSDIDSVEYDR